MALGIKMRETVFLKLDMLSSFYLGMKPPLT